MQKLPLIGGSYSARSVIANAQRCLNLYPEANRGDAPVPVTHYQRPGLTVLATPGTPGAARCLYQASNGAGYMIVGGSVYYIDENFALHPLGAVDETRDTPCSMIDNGTTGVIVLGAPYAGNATGFINFTASGNPSPGDTITLDGTVWTFVASGATGPQTNIQGTIGFTLAQLITDLQASVDPNVSEGFYDFLSGAVDKLLVTGKQAGALGTTFTLAASAAAPSGAHLTLGTVFPGIGYTFDLGATANGSLVFITDPSWTGADRIDVIDTFFIWNAPGTNQFWSSTSNTPITPIDPTYVASKSGYPDRLASIIVNHNEILLLGELKSEVWYDAGNPQFPFARITGVYIEHGTIAKYSVTSADLNIYWLGRDLQGQGVVFRKRGYEAKRISNYALEYQIRLMSQAGGTISDAVGYTYQVDGHLFYVLTFPTGNQTWVWDESVGDPELGWSQRGWTDGNGKFNRDRGVLGAWLYGKNCVLDWETGTLYEQDMTSSVDSVSGQDYPILFLRTFPHLMAGIDPRTGSPVLAEGRMVQHSRFQLDAECGTGTSQQQPQFNLRWSDDRGKTWGTAVLQSAGTLGQYETRPDWSGLGQAMDRVYEVSWTFPGPVALNGAWVDGIVGPR